MAQLLTNRFTSYALTPAEEKSGATLNSMQKQVIQNKLAEIAEQRLGITFDGKNPVDFAQQEAFLTGQMGILTWLLEQSEVIEQEIRTEYEE